MRTNVIRQFQDTVCKYGNEIALTWNNKDYTFHEIDHQSNLVAGYLMDKGFTSCHVGCCMRRTVLWPIALLGLLKARCSYTPLDLANPKERLHEIIRDADISFIITDENCPTDLGRIPSKSITDILHADIYTALPDIEPDDLAYIFYTSGTTGKPKGIPATHRQLSLVPDYWANNVFHTTAGEHVLQMAGMNFHVSVMETITFLTVGAHIFMIGDDEKKDPVLLANWLNRQHIERAFIAPAILTVMPHIELPSLKTIVVAGEPCPEHVRDYWIQQHMMVNTYGCTETTVCIGSDIQRQDMPVNNVGHINPALEYAIVDAELHEVPDGMAGELCIGGPSVTSGYWHLPQTNAEKFIENRYSTQPNHCQMLFRTGDYVEKMPDGTLLHKGRIDDQVKIRGMRIETREIEIALESHPQVDKAIVVAKVIKQAKRLVAYVKLSRDMETDLLKSHMAALLPDYMWPFVYVKMQDFPVNINNKVMRSQLPAPVIDCTQVDRSDWSLTEKRVSSVLQDVLGLAPIDLSDTFVAMGVDSISSIIFADKLNKEFHSCLNVWDLQQHQTIRELANYLDNCIPVPEEKGQEQNQSSPRQFIELPQSLKDLWASCHKSDKKNAAYKMFFVFSFDKGTDIPLLEKAWNKVIEHQDVLRLTFILQHGSLVGRFIPYTKHALPVEHINTKDYPAKSKAYYDQTEISFEECLFHAKLFRFSGGSLKLCIVIHHLITDGLSWQLIYNLLSRYYDDAKEGRLSTDETVSFQQYLEWKIQQEKNETDQRKAFWKGYLHHLEPLVLKKTGQTSSSDAALKKFHLNDTDEKKFISYCHQEGHTPASVLLTLFGYITGKYIGQKDFAIALAATDREEVRFINTLGYMVSMLPIRTSQETASPFTHVVRQVAEQTAQARQQAVPLSELMKMTGAADESDFLNIGFGMENTNLDILLSEDIIQPAPFALTLYAGISHEDVSLAFQYDRKYFSDQAIDSMIKCYSYVLRQLLNHPDMSLDQCELVEKSVSGNVHGQMPSDTVTSGFLKSFFLQSSEHPQNTAYRINGRDVTYEQLDRMSESAAISIRHILRNHQSLNIGVCLRGKDYLLPVVIALLRQGLCYVPIDAELPLERIRHIIEDAQIHFIISDNEVCSALKGIAVIPATEQLFTQQASATIRIEPMPDTPAYTIFTSGSTGRPKGIPITHANLAVFCRNFIRLTNLQTNTRTLQFASIGFDASVLEIFPTLSAGATVVFPTQEQRSSSIQLLNLIEEERISLALIPPSLLAILPYRQLPLLRTLLVGGESTAKDVQERWRKGRTLINAYGPTENTVMATAMVMRDDTPYNNIGYPFDGVCCLVLDDLMRQLPDYAVGELYIGGQQLSTGYLNNAKQNQQHFICHPSWGRLYRSGDLVMRTQDGSFLFLGRKDSQVKIRGFRIELSEIKRVLEDMPGIHQAYITATGSDHQARLTAYCTKDEDDTISKQEITDRLSALLPQYMVPNAIIFLDRFPLTINNKIDVSRLPNPTTSAQYTEPLPGAEQQMADIICQLLHQERVSATANLFYEGLTSILAMQLVCQLSQTGLPYSYTDIYRHKSIRQIVASGHSKAWHWHNEDTGKPVAVLVCGYTPFSPFYEVFAERLSRSFSVLVFDAFPVYYALHPEQPSEAKQYIGFMHEVVRSEMKKRGTAVAAITGHSIGSEFAILLAERLLIADNMPTRVVAIGTSFKTDEQLLEAIGDKDRLLKSMQKSMPRLIFHGDLRLVLEQHPSSSMTLSADSPQTGNKIQAITDTHLKDNLVRWKKVYPHSIRLLLDTDHFGMLHPDYMDDIMKLF